MRFEYLSFLFGKYTKKMYLLYVFHALKKEYHDEPCIVFDGIFFRKKKEECQRSCIGKKQLSSYLYS